MESNATGGNKFNNTLTSAGTNKYIDKAWTQFLAQQQKAKDLNGGQSMEGCELSETWNPFKNLKEAVKYGLNFSSGLLDMLESAKSEVHEQDKSIASQSRIIEDLLG